MAAPDNNKVERVSSFPPLWKQVTAKYVQATAPRQNFDRQAIFAEDAVTAECHMTITRHACPRLRRAISSGVQQKLNIRLISPQHSFVQKGRTAELLATFWYRISSKSFGLKLHGTIGMAEVQ